MERPKRMRNLVGILKDKVSLIKATLLLSTKPTTSYHLAILRATTHHPTEPPPLYTLEDVLSLGHNHRPTASALLNTLLRRLHRTHSTHVALKCLLTLHHILARGSPVLKDQITCDNIINLSTFRDESDVDTWELSMWVRWYAKVLEQSLYLSHLTGQTQITRLSSLVAMVEQICGAPESLHYKRIGLIYEVLKLVGEDYRMTLREIFARITEINERIDELSDDEVGELLGDLKRLEDCKEKLFFMFLNKKKNDGAWDFIARLRKDVEKLKEKRKSLRLIRCQTSGSQPGDVGSKPLAIVSAPRGKRWLDVDWNPLVVSGA